MGVHGGGVAVDLRRRDWMERDQLPRLSLEKWPWLEERAWPNLLAIEGGEISNAHRRHGREFLESW